MDLFLKQRIFSWGKKFDIYDASGAVVYTCKGEVFSFGHKLRIFDTQGRELVYIEQEIFRFLPRYHINIDGACAATIIHKFSFFRHDFRYEKLNWRIEGDFFAHDYRILNNSNVVMDIEKQWFAWGDTYHLHINDKYNPLICLASAIVVDCVCHDGDNH